MLCIIESQIGHIKVSIINTDILFLNTNLSNIIYLLKQNDIIISIQKHKISNII